MQVDISRRSPITNSSASVRAYSGAFTSTPRTQWPRALSEVTRWWPMKPPAPVTRIRECCNIKLPKGSRSVRRRETRTPPCHLCGCGGCSACVGPHFSPARRARSTEDALETLSCQAKVRSRVARHRMRRRGWTRLYRRAGGLGRRRGAGAAGARPRNQDAHLDRRTAVVVARLPERGRRVFERAPLALRLRDREPLTAAPKPDLRVEDAHPPSPSRMCFERSEPARAPCLASAQ